VQIGAVFPQNEIGADAGAVRAFAEAADALGYRHLLAYDHVLGADTTVHPGWSGPYDLEDTFHEPFVLFSWLAAKTTLEFATAILVGPQRQTALVAKQAAELDILSGGERLRLGLGIGWNRVEYQALGQTFSDRAARLEEQVVVLRRLWTEPSVTFSGAFHTIEGAGIAPLPITRPIPVWLGAMAPAALRRVGRIADGWFPQVRPGGGLEEALEVIAGAAVEVGRDPGTIGMEGQVLWTPDDPDRLAHHADRWRRSGASHLALNTMGAVAGAEDGPDGSKSGSVVDGHIALLGAAAEVLIGA
jgi:probable F420-dependent oxidoreductase